MSYEEARWSHDLQSVHKQQGRFLLQSLNINTTA